VRYDPKELEANFQRELDKQVKDGLLSAAEARRMNEFFTKGLMGTTYLNLDEPVKGKAPSPKTKKAR